MLSKIKERKDIIVLLIWNLLFFSLGYYAYGGPRIRPDTFGYQIESLSDITWRDRTIGYQLFSLLFYRICGNNYEIADIFIVISHCFIAAIGNILIYCVIRKYTNKKQISMIFGFIGSAVLALFGYEYYLLTESLAVSVMCIQLWCLCNAVMTKKIKFFYLLSIFSLIGTMIRPSHVFSMALIAVFFTCFLSVDKATAVKSLLCWLICLVPILLHCLKVYSIIGVFTLSSVGPTNAMYIVIDSGIYENEDYPEIAQLVKEEIADESTNYWADAKAVCNTAGYPLAVEYIKDCKQKHLKQYLEYTARWSISQSKWTILHNYDSEGVSAVIQLFKGTFFPFNFLFMIIITILDLIYCLYKQFRDRQWYWFELGCCSCIIGIVGLSCYACHSAELQRIGICSIPCFIVLSAIIVNNCLNYFIKNH